MTAVGARRTYFGGEPIAVDWAQALEPVSAELAELEAFVADERANGGDVQPADALILRAFERPLADVRVLIVGQDPYPTPGHAVGLSFATSAATQPLPRSLRNIYRELAEDTGVHPPAHGDVSAWADQGVLLLNRVLTVRAGEAGAHAGRGWEQITECAIRALVERGGPLVAVLWGKQAAALAPLLGDTPVIQSAHPSPLSASRGFFGSRPFSRVNALLHAQGADPVEWSLGDSGTLW